MGSQVDEGCRKTEVSPTCQELIAAVKLGDLDSVEKICKKGVVRVDTRYGGMTPLGLATTRRDTAMVELLVRYGADPNKRWKDHAGRDEPPLITLTRLGHAHLARIILNIDKVELDAMDNQGRTALWTAVENRKPQLVSLLLGAGCRLDLVPPGCISSGSALHLAIRSSGYISGQEIAFLLIQAGANLWLEDRENRTPLAWAVYVNNLELVEELLLLGSNPWKVSRKVMESAGNEVMALLNIYKKRVPRLQELARRAIRRAVASSGVAGKSAFVVKIRTLTLPQKLQDYIITY